MTCAHEIKTLTSFTDVKFEIDFITNLNKFKQLKLLRWNPFMCIYFSVKSSKLSLNNIISNLNVNDRLSEYNIIYLYLHLFNLSAVYD